MAYENIKLDENGKVDFLDTSITSNGRGVVLRKYIKGTGEGIDLEKANKILGTVALAEIGLVEAAEREGFARDGLASFEMFEIELPGVSEPNRVIGWKLQAAGAS